MTTMKIAEKITTEAFWLPTRPYTITDAINRVGAATGSVRNAQAASGADYNGHLVSVGFNDFRQYWIAQYWWAGRCVVARGDFRRVALAAKALYDRGALGCEVRITVPAEEREWALEQGFVPWSKEAEDNHDATWRDARFKEVSSAIRYEQQLGVPAVGFLANSKTIEEYEAKVESHLAERRSNR